MGLNAILVYEIRSAQTNLPYFIYLVPNFLERENIVNLISWDFSRMFEISRRAKKNITCPASHLNMYF